MAKFLNLGCGGNVIAGWENHDIDVDITKPLPYANDTFEFILAEHVFEHISGPKGFAFLKECYRILKSGHVLRLCVPTLDRLEDEAAIDIVINHGHEVVLDAYIVTRLLSLAGFRNIHPSNRNACDGHWRVIGEQRDDRETLRIEGTK